MEKRDAKLKKNLFTSCTTFTITIIFYSILYFNSLCSDHFSTSVEG